MTRVRNQLERLDAANSAHDRRHYAREFDVSVHQAPAAFGAHRMTRYAYGRELHAIARAPGASLAAGYRCRSLSRLASAYRSRERPERSEEAYLYLLAPRLGGSHHFGRGLHRSPQAALGLRLARGHQRAVRDRGRFSSGEGTARHPAHAPAVLFGNRFMARISCHEAVLASTACHDRRFAEAPSAARYCDIALLISKRPPSLTGALSCRKSTAFQTRVLFRSHGPRFCRFRQYWRHEVRAFDAPAPHHQRRDIAPAHEFPMGAPMGRGERR
ncbi:hypothetical protein SAMN02927924_03728 [Sphingobium faniae]|nr:hypothetical protein SAMN02927924_03728 [Sphingobium faniae]